MPRDLKRGSAVQVAAEGELALEQARVVKGGIMSRKERLLQSRQARCRLCELREFDPNEFFLTDWGSSQN